MKNLTLENLTKVCGGVYSGPSDKLEQEVSSITTDSRKAEAGTLFVPIVGERVDHHNILHLKKKTGALATLSERILENADFPYIKVESSLQAVKDIAEFYLQQLQIPVVGITGSVGKTSTKEMISAVLEQKYNVLKTEGNFNNEIGLPLTILRIRREHEAAVVEMGISEFGEMHRIAKVAKPDICVMTNIGQCHLENLIDRDGVLRAKSEIFDFLKPDGHIVLNGNEIGGGSIRIHQNDIQSKMFEVLGFTPEQAQKQFGFLLDAFKYGVPPHAGLAYGLDRLIMLMAGEDSIREVMAFPKVKDASCLMMQAPDEVDPKQLEELGLEIEKKEEKEEK